MNADLKDQKLILFIPKTRIPFFPSKKLRSFQRLRDLCVKKLASICFRSRFFFLSIPVDF